MATCTVGAAIERNVASWWQTNDRIVVVATVATGCTNIGVVKRSGIPIRRIVAIFASIAGGNVGCRIFGAQRALAGCRCAIVAGEAGCDGQFRMVEGRCRNECRSIVAALAGICRLHVLGRWPLQPADNWAGGNGLCAVVAAHTRGTFGLGVIKRRSLPVHKIGVGMAALARIRRGQVVVRFSQCRRPAAVVAGDAIANDAGMIELGTGPCDEVVCIMAIRAIVRGWHVWWVGVRFAQSWRMGTRVAREAIGDVLRQGVVELGRSPRSCNMASAAIIRGFEVGRGTARSAATIMAVHAVRDIASLTMIEMRRGPGNRGVAGLAQLAGQHMRLRFAGGCHTVVALRTAINDTSVVEHADVPGEHGVA